MAASCSIDAAWAISPSAVKRDGLPAKALRENEAARKAVAKSADEIVAEVGKFFA